MREEIEYYSSGEIMCKGFRQNGKREGEWTWYYITGEVHSKNYYISGKRVPEQTYKQLENLELIIK